MLLVELIRLPAPAFATVMPKVAAVASATAPPAVTPDCGPREPAVTELTLSDPAESLIETCAAAPVALAEIAVVPALLIVIGIAPAIEPIPDAD